MTIKEKRGCNGCEWTGTTDRMLGSIGPLCPECGETTEAMVPANKHISLKQMAEDKALPGVGKVTTFAVDPHMMRKPKPGSNRPLDPDHVRTLADAYHRGATFPPLEVIVDGGVIEPADGQHRLEAALLAISEGAEIRALECRQFRGNAADVVVLQVSSQEGLKMSPLVRADRYAKLVAWGWSVPDIALRVGKTETHVRDCLALLDADPKAKALLAKGQVSADVVRKTVREHGAGAGEVLQADLEKVQAAGGTKVTAKTASAKAPSKGQRALDLLERMRTAFEGTHVHMAFDDQLVDDVRAFLNIKE
jgi:ParB-like chromosome segregation protein Spo0J